jgi:N-acetyl-anhydromuramyl-L-alanine amidase AmpD
MVDKNFLDTVPFWQAHSQGSRGDFEPYGIVIHYTGGSDGRKTAQWLRSAESGRSAHLLGFRDGEGCQLVPFNRAAWHAGASEWLYKGRWTRNCNLWTIGIELSNHGYLYRSHSGKFHYECGGRMWRYYGPNPVRARISWKDGPTFEGWWEPYSEPQLMWLHKTILKLRELGCRVRLAGHDEIAVPAGRKKDPGPLFPWDRFRTGRDPWVSQRSVEILEAA